MAHSTSLATAYLGLGSNLGDRLAALRGAVHALDRFPCVNLETSRGVASLYETSPVGGSPGQGPFLNSCVRVATTLSLRELMCAVLAVEESLGRARKERWDPRAIDIDLLLYDDLVAEEPDLSVPHPRLHERRFVLEPLAEIAPEVVHPVLKTTIARLAAGRRAETGGEIVVLFAPQGWHLKAVRSVPTS